MGLTKDGDSQNMSIEDENKDAVEPVGADDSATTDESVSVPDTTDSEAVESSPAVKGKKGKRGKETDSKPEGKKRRLPVPQLPAFLRKKEGEAPAGDALLGSSGADDRTSAFTGIKIQDDAVGHIPSEKESKKQAKRSAVSFGAKYGGQRRIFLFLAAALLLSLGLNVLNFAVGTTKASNNSVGQLVQEEVANSTASEFPVGDAAMWTESFVRIYGTWDYKTPGGRATDLSPYLAPGVDQQAGWDGNGTQSVIYSAVSSQPDIIDKNRAMFKATYQVGDGTWRCLSIPVYAYKPTDASQGPTNTFGFAVTANPTPVPCALRVSAPDTGETDFANTDQEAASTLQQTFFPGFFSAWVSSDADSLRQYMAPDVTTFGLGGTYQSNVEVTSVVLPIGAAEEKAAPGTVYSAYVTVQLTANDGSKTTATYKVPVASTGSQWQVMGEPEPVLEDPNNVPDNSLDQGEGKAKPGEEVDDEDANTYPDSNGTSPEQQEPGN